MGKRVSGSSTDYGNGTSTGLGAWVGPAGSSNLRDFAKTNSLTAYYRPEDFDIDRSAEAAGNVRFCANNTGNESSGGGGRTWGETLCITDGSIADAGTIAATPEAQYFVINNADMATFQEWLDERYGPRLVVHEFPTVDCRGIPSDLLAAAKRELRDLVEGGNTVVVVDSAGAERTARVCEACGYEPMA